MTWSWPRAGDGKLRMSSALTKCLRWFFDLLPPPRRSVVPLGCKDSATPREEFVWLGRLGLFVVGWFLLLLEEEEDRRIVWFDWTRSLRSTRRNRSQTLLGFASLKDSFFEYVKFVDHDDLGVHSPRDLLKLCFCEPDMNVRQILPIKNDDDSPSEWVGPR